MTRFVVDMNDVIHNYEQIAHGTDALVIPTLKADCYGLGALPVMEALRDRCGVALFAVSRLEEALQLAGKGAEILLLSCYHDLPSLQTAVDADVTVAVDSLAQARRIGEYALSVGKTARVHIKIDTGFGRFGFFPSQIADIKQVYTVEGIKASGIFSHFYESFRPRSKATARQLEQFKTLLDQLRESGVEIGLRHIANSCGALGGRETHLDAVRIGSALLGRLPMPTGTELTRVGRFETQIIDIRTLKKGSNIGYGGVYRLPRDARVAVLPVGTADGVLTGKGYDAYRVRDILRYGWHVLQMLFKDNRLTATVGGRRVRAVGRVALTHTMVDVTDLDCRCGDAVTLDLSPLYISPNVPRVYENV